MKEVLCFLFFAVVSNSVFSQTITNGLLVHYKFNGDAIDQTSNSYDGNVSGVAFVEDEDGNQNSAFYFDGVDDFVDFPNFSALKPDIPFSYSLVVKFDHLNQVGSQMFTSDFQENNYHGSWTQLSADGTGRVGLSYAGGLGGNDSSNRRTKLSEGTVVPQKWYRLTLIVRGATDMDIYIDCLNAGGGYSGSGSVQIAYSSVPGSIGRTDAHSGLAPYYFQGTLDDFAFWDRALSEAEVVSLCEGALGVEELTTNSHLVSAYPNPFKQNVSFGFVNPSGSKCYLKMVDAMGRMVRKTEVVTSEQIELNRDVLENGVYFYQLINADKREVIGNGKIILTDYSSSF